jgi:hypothetical protein
MSSVFRGARGGIQLIWTAVISDTLAQCHIRPALPCELGNRPSSFAEHLSAMPFPRSMARSEARDLALGQRQQSAADGDESRKDNPRPSQSYCLPGCRCGGNPCRKTSYSHEPALSRSFYHGDPNVRDSGRNIKGGPFSLSYLGRIGLLSPCSRPGGDSLPSSAIVN